MIYGSLPQEIWHKILNDAAMSHAKYRSTICWKTINDEFTVAVWCAVCVSYPGRQAIPLESKWFIPCPSVHIDTHRVIRFACPRTPLDRGCKKAAAMLYGKHMGLSSTDPNNKHKIHPYCSKIAGL